MITAKNEAIGLHENCYLVVGNESLVGDKNLVGGLFLLEEKWVNFRLVGGLFPSWENPDLFIIENT